MTTRSKVNGTALEKRAVEGARAAGLAARKQPLSGVLDAEYPSDAVIDDFLAECKMRAAWLDSKGAKILSLNLDWLAKVRANAKRVGLAAGILISRAKGSPQLYVTMAYEDWLELLKASK